MPTIQPTPRYSNQELVIGISDSDNRVLDFIYAHQFKSVLHFVLRNSGRESDAHDVFQEALVATWLNIREGKFQMKENASVAGYIFQISKNKWRDRLRSQQYKNTLPLVYENLENGTQFQDHATAEEMEVRAQYLQELYSSLGDQCKQILLKFYYQKKSLDQIGEEMGYSASSLRTMKYRCMMQLRKLHLQNSSGKK